MSDSCKAYNAAGNQDSKQKSEYHIPLSIKKIEQKTDKQTSPKGVEHVYP
jgi:hypothetical protein